MALTGGSHNDWRQPQQSHKSHTCRVRVRVRMRVRVRVRVREGVRVRVRVRVLGEG